MDNRIEDGNAVREALKQKLYAVVLYPYMAVGDVMSLQVRATNREQAVRKAKIEMSYTTLYLIDELELHSVTRFYP